ncbi:MAG TPA: hypothetical protein VMZ27_17620 [Candidatus Saccharimonadales bacterium]|nr:hypothetical protein [Candidatus Saccharimonadales bacterium]
MKRFTMQLGVAGLLCLASITQAAPQAKTYQVTGPVLEVTDSSITVQKGDEKWQVARDKSTKVSGDIKVGSKVTIEYQMVAKDVEVKTEKKK